MSSVVSLWLEGYQLNFSKIGLLNQQRKLFTVWFQIFLSQAVTAMFQFKVSETTRFV